MLALQVAHAFDNLTGDVARLGDRVRGVLPAWSSELPGYHAVLAMHAFGLQEIGDYAGAEEVARRALALDPSDARAHHALAHVFEMTGRADAGIAWLQEHSEHWATGTVVATHCWWHLALFHLAKDQVERALSLDDTRVRIDRSPEVADMIDAAALLWRIELRGGDVGTRWGELAAAWVPHIADLLSVIQFTTTGANRFSERFRLEKETSGNDNLLADLDAGGKLHQFTVA